MCVNCISNAEAAVASAAMVTAVLRAPVHKALAQAGVLAAPDPVRRDVRTVQFLRALDLEPAAVLGEAVVAAADRWTPAAHRPLRWRIPIGSQRVLAAQ